MEGGVVVHKGADGGGEVEGGGVAQLDTFARDAGGGVHVFL